eukprot:m.11218 g.11218  ORF g.11218 m.11218 type:complete len:149 (+) comp23086_c1_seq2:1471-1917(+)
MDECVCMLFSTVLSSPTSFNPEVVYVVGEGRRDSYRCVIVPEQHHLRIRVPFAFCIDSKADASLVGNRPCLPPLTLTLTPLHDFRQFTTTRYKRPIILRRITIRLTAATEWRRNVASFPSERIASNRFTTLEKRSERDALVLSRNVGR